MMHFTCDQCGKELIAGEDERFVLRIEAFPALDPAQLTEADLDDDHLEAVSELLCDLEDDDVDLPEPAHHFRYDLCAGCHERFVRDPLSKEHQHKMYFSKN